MKTNLHIFCILFVPACLLSFPLSSKAQELLNTSNKFRLEGSLGAGKGLDDYVVGKNSDGDDVKLSAGGGIGGAFSLGYALSSSFDLDVTAGIQRSDLSSDVPGVTINFTRNLFLITFKRKIPISKSAQFKAGGGLGYYFSGKLYSDEPGANDIMKFDSATGIHFTGEYEALFSNNWSLVFGAKYYNVKYKVNSWQHNGAHVSESYLNEEIKNFDGSGVDFLVGVGKYFGSNKSDAKTIEEKIPHSMEIGLMYYHFDYKEELPSPYKSTENGWLPGIFLNYRYQGITNPLYLKLLIELSESKTNFDGTTQAGSPVKDNTNNRFMKVEGNLGFKLTEGSDEFGLTVYYGLGYRVWERGLSGQVPYSEEYSWKYLPFGIYTDYRINDKWNWVVEIAYKVMLDGKIKLDMTGTNNPVLTLGNKNGWSIEAPFYYKLTNSHSLFVAPWYEYSGIGKGADELLTTDSGTPIAILYEPASDTTQYGINVGIKLR